MLAPLNVQAVLESVGKALRTDANGRLRR